jgi:20S proteasome alpha/beta subunit
MTCIVGLVGRKGVMIAGDAQGSTQWVKREDSQAKVFQLSDVLCVGYCGSGRFGQILQYHVMDALDDPPLLEDEHRWIVRNFVPHLRDVTTDHGHLEVHHNVETFGPSEFLLAVRGRLFVVDCEFGVSEHVLPWESVGSGAETAVGSIHGELGDDGGPLSDARLEAIATRAIEAAEKTTNYVGGKISFVKTVLYTPAEKALARRIVSGR